jgi:chromosomal replication initiation ATPase DnaA
MVCERCSHQYLVISSTSLAQHLQLLHLRGVIEQAVASVFSVPVPELRSRTRCRASAAFARQVAMYLAHVGFGLSFTCVGRLFQRDRTTVAHGCGIVEDKRDEPGFDLALSIVESVLRARVATAPGGAR